MFTQLDAINLCITSVGGLPVTSVSSGHPDVLSAKLVIERTSKRLQSTGWWFNIQRTFKLSPQAPRSNTGKGEIILPADTLRVELVDYPSRGVQRAKRLYDIRNNTFIWTHDVTANITTAVDFDELPASFQEYVMYSAAKEFQASYEGDPTKYADIREELMQALTKVRREEIRWKKLNTRTNPQFQRFMGRQQRQGMTFNPAYPGGRG